MKNLTLIVLVIIAFAILKYSEKFTSILNGFDNNWGDFDSSNLQKYNPTKTSKLISNCDEKRGVCISY